MKLMISQSQKISTFFLSPYTTYMEFEPFTFVLERLTDLLINGIGILSIDVKDELGNLHKELQIIQSYLKDIDEVKRRASISHVLNTQVQWVKETVPEIEAMIDIVLQDEMDTSQERYFKKLKTYLSYTSNPFVRNYRMVKSIRDVNEKIQKITKSMKRYQVFEKPTQVCYKKRSRTSPYISNVEFIIGLEEDVHILVRKLTENVGDYKTLLAIVGMGGCGKTTLARKLYINKEIEKHYSYRVWVCVSQEWDTKRLVHEMCEQVGLPLLQGETTNPFVTFARFLQQNSCLFVLDDVWRREALQELLSTLLQGENGGIHRIIITTRNKQIVHFPTLGCFIHEARHLTQEESWQLFSMIIRKSWQGMYTLEDDGDFAFFGRNMLKKCNGLPLAIVALAGFLCTKNTIQEWKKVENDVCSRIMRNDIGTHDCEALEEILELSYDDLPYFLKPCFLYLGIFPEDYKIEVEVLIQLWIAEGFITAKQIFGSETLEDASMEFVDQLIMRCMVQVIHKDYEGKVNAIQVHDLMRDLCIKKAKELNFFETSSSTTSNPIFMSRAIIYQWHSFSIDNPRLRSLVHFGYIDQRTKEIDMPYEKMKTLRVLDLKKVDFKGTLEQIGSMTLLRYVNIEWCSGIKELPQSLQDLRNLLTFTYKGNEVRVPNNMVGKMEQLRHLCLAFNPTTIEALGVDNSKTLQVLDTRAGQWLIGELHTLKVLRHLLLSKIHMPTHLKVISNSLGIMSSHLQDLRLQLEPSSGLEFDLQKLGLQDCHLLKDLRLVGKIKEQNPLGLFPPNLLCLRLGMSEIQDNEHLNGTLEQLARLRSLTLNKGSYTGSKMNMTRLSQLYELNLRKLENLKDWRIEVGALPQLRRLSIESCDQLERVPCGISYVTTLELFEANDMPESFCKRLERPTTTPEGGGHQGEGKDFHLIQNISSVQIKTSFNKVRQQYIMDLSGFRCVGLMPI